MVKASRVLLLVLVVLFVLFGCQNTDALLIHDKSFLHKNRLKNGSYVEVDTNGYFELVHYQAGQFEGPYFKYYKTGELMVEGYYSHGKKDSSWSYYFIEGITAGVDTYKKGKCISRGLNGCPKF